MKKEKVFYDIHCHAMNMSHPYMMAFLQRCVKALKKITVEEIFKSIRTMTNIRIISEMYDMLLSVNEAKNLISVMENDVGSIFLIMEECISGKYNYEKTFLKDGQFGVAGNTYTKIILTPLMMDFGCKHLEDLGTYYNHPARKPLNEQVIDVFNGISTYMKKSKSKIFEIYPFFGLNTRNYTFDRLKELLDKYFKNYKRSRSELLKNMGAFSGDPEGISSNFFAGVKIYPPLGFDPWPEGEAEEIEKVEYLYSYCCEKNIPITAHCNDEGFIVCGEADALKYTSPARWEDVLKRYPKLILNLAHFGRQMANPTGDWAVKICGLMLKYDNLYADFSFNGVDPKYYEAMRKLIDRSPQEINEKLYKRILFGSDFMMSLLKIQSYSKYIDQFSSTPFFGSNEKDAFCSANPERFLFKKQI
ncbi:MAG TPA: amidohydrolase family protein [Candidatus Wallbacteria bacterium]|nr:amidohydrolase family protein [Candidatus Wallbacteria bacterium]